jgi:hypothetical protein
MVLVSKTASPLLSQLDLAKIHHDGITEEPIDYLITLYLKFKRIFLKAKRRCKTLWRKTEEILVEERIMEIAMVPLVESSVSLADESIITPSMVT